MGRIRRTKQEIEAGLTIEDKKAGKTLKDLIAKKKKTSEYQVTDERYDEETNIRYIYKTKEVEVEKEVEVPVVKEVRILNGTKQTKKSVQEILDLELEKCIWDWKEVFLDKKFKISMLEKLGKQGWKFAFSLDWKAIKPSWKDKPETLFFQKAKKGAR